MPKVLIVGGGGREHALAWKLASEAEIYTAPGNPGTAEVGENLEIPSDDPAALIEAARRLEVDLVVIGPEDPLIAGLADAFREQAIPVFGPSRSAARLEGSKAFAKEAMVSAGVPTAPFRAFTEAQLASAYARERFAEGRQVAVKASGAALGKGVVVCSTLEEADSAIEAMLVLGELGAAGEQIVVEDRLFGAEFSLIALCAGRSFRCLPPARDHKRAFEGDRGPNTGGMGAFSPLPDVDDLLAEQAAEKIIAPILGELEKTGADYRGALFAGIMVQDGQPYCLEYNVRFGDPETQTLMRRVGAGFYEALVACARREPCPPVDVEENASVTVVVASGGYPGPVEKGLPIELAPPPPGVLYFHAGTGVSEGRLVTRGGRVIGVSAVGSTLEEARRRAFAGVEGVRFAGARWRSDIAAS